MGSSSIDFDTPPALDFERLRDWRGSLVDHLRARWPYWVLGAIVLLTALVYGRALGYEHLHAFDDNLYVLNRPEVRDWWGATWWQRVLTPKTGYSVAVPTFVYAHVRMVFPDQFPHVLHGVNLAVHLLNVVLVFVLAKRWTDENVAVVVAAIWGLHPMQVESVAWLTNLKVVLFGTGSLLWLLGCESYVDRARDQRSVWPIAAALFVVFLATLGSRPNAAMFPVFAGIVVWRRGGLDERWGPLATVVVCAVAVSALYVPLAISEHSEFVEMLGAEASSPLWEKYRRMSAAAWLQASNFFWPAELHPAYYLEAESGVRASIPGVLVVAAAIAATVSFSYRNLRDLGTGWLVAVVGYAPYSQIVSIPRLTADSYIYVPSVGLAVVIAGAAANFWRSSPWIERKLSALGYAALPIVVAVGLVGALSVRSYSQVGRWRNLLTLWAPVVEQAPRAWKPYMHVAWQYYHWNDYAESAAVLDEGLPVFRAQRVYPDFMPLVYERVGEPRRALKLAAESIGRGQRVTKYKYEILLGLLARHELPTSGGREFRRILKRAVESVTSDRRWMRNRQRRIALADYFVEFDRPAMARPFLQAELRSRDPNCEVWRLADRLPQSVRSELSVPDRPARCRD